MGRTLHYEIKKESNFTKKELLKIYGICQFYNSDTLLKDINDTFKTSLTELWSCENFWIGLGSYYPNWQHPLFTKERGSEFAWNFIGAKKEELMKTLDYYDTLAKLEKEGWIIEAIPKGNTLNGFTKTQGNEFNSMLVLQALTDISNALPNVEIRLSDEGEFLLCPLKIKKGKALPLIDDLIENLQSYALRMLFSKGFKGNILNKITPTDFTDAFKGDIGIENGYGDMTVYVNNTLRNLKEIETVLISEGFRGNNLYFYNITNCPLKWITPKKLTRPVDVEKFLNYKMGTGTLMDGFLGEGFDLTDKDSEAESYKSIARMFSFLEKLGVDKKNVQVLGGKS